MAALEFRVLGPFEVVGDGRLLDVGSGKQRALLAMLLVQANTVVSTDRLLDGLWNGEPPANARHALQVYVSNLRKVLEPGRSPGGNGQVLVTRAPGYLLQVGSERLDVAGFERLVANGRQAVAEGRAEEAAELLRAALGMWRGPVLADLTDLPFARVQSARWEQLRLQALEARLDADLALGRHLELVGELETLVAMHPLRERFWCQLMLALYRASRQGEALQVYQVARELLVDQLGIDPGVQMRQLHAAILRQDPTLAPSAVTVGACSGVTTPNTVPTQLSSFIGRERELREICQLVMRSRLVTLTGVGGVGKSRLALEAAATLRAEHPEGTWLVELVPVTEPSLVVHTVARVLGVWEHPQRSLIDRLAERLWRAEVLVVLDNCEHLIQGVAEVAGQLLALCPGLRMLATSRERLGIAGEVLYPVSGLSVPPPGGTQASVVMRSEAAQLFVERAHAVHPGFRVADASARAIAHVCRSLDGLPLAIELAAARTNALAIEQIAARLDDRFHLLTRGDRTAFARHQTLRAVVDWSYELLSEAERRMFDRLAVFVDGFTLEAAETVCAGPGEEKDVVELLSRLVDKSLVTAQTLEQSTARYRMLETLRVYGLHRLHERNETDQLHERHAAFFLSFVKPASEALRGPEQSMWLDRLASEHGNLRAALEWYLTQGRAESALRIASSLYRFWAIRGYYTEGRQWFTRALAANGPVSATTRSRAFVDTAMLAVIQGDLQEAIGACEQAVTFCRYSGTNVGLAHALGHLGFMITYTGELDRAEALLKESLRISRHASAGWVEYRSLLFLATVSLAQGKYPQAVEFASQSEATLRPVGDREGLAWTLAIRGCAACRHGDYQAASISLQASLEEFQNLSSLWGLSLSLFATALFARAHGHWHQAANLLGASEALHETIGAAIMPFVNIWVDETVTEISNALGTHTFDHARQHGRTLTPTTAVEQAMRTLNTAQNATNHPQADITLNPHDSQPATSPQKIRTL